MSESGLKIYSSVENTETIYKIEAPTKLKIISNETSFSNAIYIGQHLRVAQNTRLYGTFAAEKGLTIHGTHVSLNTNDPRNLYENSSFMLDPNYASTYNNYFNGLLYNVDAVDPSITYTKYVTGIKVPGGTRTILTELDETGLLINGNINIVNPTTTDTNPVASLNLYGAHFSSSGRVYVGQSLGIGGGIQYNGGSDRMQIYRRNADLDSVVMSYSYESDDIKFSGNAEFPGNLYFPNSGGTPNNNEYQNRAFTEATYKLIERNREDIDRILIALGI